MARRLCGTDACGVDECRLNAAIRRGSAALRDTRFHTAAPDATTWNGDTQMVHARTIGFLAAILAFGAGFSVIAADNTFERAERVVHHDVRALG